MESKAMKHRHATVTGQPKPPAERVKNRATRRAMERVAKVAPEPAQRVSMVGLGRAKPTKSPVWASMQAEAGARRILRGIRVWKLVEECPEMRLVEGFGSVYALATASAEAIGAVPGLGPVKRKRIHAYLLSKNVPVKWEA